MATEPSDPTDPVELYDQLVMAGNAPDPETFAQRYPDHPDLLRRLRALDALRSELDELARDVKGNEVVFKEEVGGFRLVEPLGRGGMGDVFLAEQQSPRRLCALKLLRHTSPVARQRFEREADLASRLSHDGIAKVFGYGFEEDQAYLATEYVDGASLRLLIKMRCSDTDADTPELPKGTQNKASEVLSTPLTVERSVRIAIGVADALGHAHAHGVIHRDIKPSNVMVTSDDKVKLIDFGIALPWLASERITQTGVFVGSHKYASPEQFQGKKDEIGPWTDTYALGTTLFQMLAGVLPFEGHEELAKKTRRGPRHGPRHFNPAVPRALNSLVLRSLNPKITKRFCDGRQMAEALEKCLER